MVRLKNISCVLAFAMTVPGLLLAESDLVVKSVFSSSSGLLIRIAYPDAFTNRLDVLMSTNLAAGRWQVLAENLATAGTNTISWTDPGVIAVPTRFYMIGNAGLDTDEDGLADAREALVYQTDPLSPDTDNDGYPDGVEIGRGTDPISSSSGALTLYADSSSGHDSYDGFSALPASGHGPKRSLGAIHAVAYSGDVIELAGGDFFREPMLCLAGKDLVLRPVGSVVVSP